MPGPKDAVQWAIAEEVQPDGSVARSVQPSGLNLLPDEEELERDLRHHVTLSGAYPVGSEFLIVANQPIRIPSPGIFSKFRLLIRDVARIAYIGVDKDIESAGLGNYDDICPGGNELEEYCNRARFLSVLIDGVPATPVEVYLYGGRFARPK